MAIPILHFWKKYYTIPDEGLGSSYERVIINNKLDQICKHYRIESVMEAPSFGFTGLSGINSFDMAKNGYDLTIFDHDEERVELIRATWKKLKQSAKIHCVQNYDYLPMEDKSVDMSWNFSALWFVNSLSQFLKELDRVTKKVVVLMVPNQLGIGYLTQKYGGTDDLNKYLKEENIDPKTIKKNMKQLGWTLQDHQFIDCPPWPDIGMAKEDFLKKFGLGFLVKEPTKEKPQLTILDYFDGSNPDFPKDVLKFDFVERNAPWIFKRFWAHHQYMIFVRG